VFVERVCVDEKMRIDMHTFRYLSGDGLMEMQIRQLSSENVYCLSKGKSSESSKYGGRTMATNNMMKIIPGIILAVSILLMNCAVAEEVPKSCVTVNHFNRAMEEFEADLVEQEIKWGDPERPFDVQRAVETVRKQFVPRYDSYVDTMCVDHDHFFRFSFYYMARVENIPASSAAMLYQMVLTHYSETNKDCDVTKCVCFSGASCSDACDNLWKNPALSMFQLTSKVAKCCRQVPCKQE